MAPSSSQGAGSQYEGSERDVKVEQLHSLIRPFLLRRLKGSVNIKLPEKRELVIYTVRGVLYLRFLSISKYYFIKGHVEHAKEILQMGVDKGYRETYTREFRQEDQK